MTDPNDAQDAAINLMQLISGVLTLRNILDLVHAARDTLPAVSVCAFKEWAKDAFISLGTALLDASTRMYGTDPTPEHVKAAQEQLRLGVLESLDLDSSCFCGNHLERMT